ncbi:MAG: hypothetical protein MCM46_13880 [Candidatus Manganitrophus sp. SB1]|nr:hypothetical protein [Candidatus Manganitrophus morganii]
MRFSFALLFFIFIFLVTQNMMIANTFAQETFTFHGQLKNETAYRYVNPASFTKIYNLARLEARYIPSSSVQLTALVRSYYDAVYDFQEVDNVVPRKNPRTILSEDLTAEEIKALRIGNLRKIEVEQKETELREFYLDLFFPRLDLRIGKQIVRWGVVEGARVTDEVNPLDFQEFILREIQDRYIPLWMIKADFYFDPNTVEILWIPDLEFHKPASVGSEWEQFQVLEGLETPSQNLKNSEWAIKVMRQIGGWDTSLSYFYTWDDFPSAFRTVFGLGEFGVSPEVAFNPRHTRLRIVGTTFSKGIESLVFNGEAAFVHGKMFGTRFGRFNPDPDSDNPDALTLTLGEIQRDYWKYALSVDWRVFGADLSLQVQQQYILGYQSEIIQDRIDTVWGLFIRKELFYGRLLLEMLTIYFVNDRELLIRPKATYQLNDAFKIAVGADIFHGEIGGPLPGEFNFVGFFKNNDRVYLELTYSF